MNIAEIDLPKIRISFAFSWFSPTSCSHIKTAAALNKDKHLKKMDVAYVYLWGI